MRCSWRPTSARGYWRLPPSRTGPLLLGTALLAYTFGLRHAVDADHISAIDNVTRKLMQAGKQPVSVGFFFSLGHSTIVIALTAAIAFAATIVHASLPGLESLGGVIGASISALFLYAIAAINVVVLIEVYRTFRRVRRANRIPLPPSMRVRTAAAYGAGSSPRSCG